VGGSRSVAGAIAVRVDQSSIDVSHKRPPDETERSPRTKQFHRFRRGAPPTKDFLTKSLSTNTQSVAEKWTVSEQL